MEREILFRGKGEFTEKWIEGYYGKVGEKGYIFTGKVVANNHLNDYGGTCFGLERHAVDPSTAGQYTGLTDKNGKKIFEGDIVATPKYGIDNEKGQNYSGKDKFAVGYSDGTYTLENGRRRYCLRPDVDAVVCGNIYDNPELLEVKK